MSDDQVAALISFGFPVVFVVSYSLGRWRGARRAARLIQRHLDQQRAARVARWAPPPTQAHGEPGTPTRLLSDYEDAIYVEARHVVAAQLGDGDEQEHVALVAQLHADVRRLRGRILERLDPVDDRPARSELAG